MGVLWGKGNVGALDFFLLFLFFLQTGIQPSSVNIPGSVNMLAQVQFA